MPYTKPEPGKPILVEIAGQSLQLRFNLRTMKALDKDHGISLFKAETGLGNAWEHPDRISLLLYYGLKEHHPQITQDWLDEHVETEMLPELFKMVIYAASGSWPELQPPKNANGQSLLTGSVSGPSEDTTSAVAKPNSGI
jgi:hypothetical protein